MKSLTPDDTFEFKGVQLNPGDHIAFEAFDVPLPHVEAAFTHVNENGDMVCFSTFLAPFRHGGVFAPDKVGRIEVVRKGDEAVPSEAKRSDGSTFARGQRISVMIDGRKHVGILLAAFDGVLSAWSESPHKGGFLIVGANHVSLT